MFPRDIISPVWQIGVMSGRSSTLAVVALIVFIDMLGIGLILPVMPKLIGEIAHTQISHAAEIGGNPPSMRIDSGFIDNSYPGDTPSANGS